MHKIILTRGIQGSGKSTAAKKWVNADPEHRIRINQDDIRSMLGKYWVPEREPLVKAIKEALLKEAMDKGYDIVLDNMNLNDKEEEYIKGIILEYNKKYYPSVYIYEFWDFFIPVEECIARDAQRPNPIGEKVIRDTFKKYRDKIISIEEEKLHKLRDKSFTPGKPNAIICDLDATLAYRSNGRPFWGEGCANGIIDDYVDFVILNILTNSDCHILFVTGREDANGIREATVDWLNKYISPKNYTLLMRNAGDYRKGFEVKKEIYTNYIKEKYNIQFVLEDSIPVVKMYREQGLLVLQPNEGKF